jgi:ArsR family transcriptional regulator, arsenate/arsenite/antimonite-responsive transcriptional repressor
MTTMLPPSVTSEQVSGYAPVTGGVVDAAAAAQIARVFKALSDPHRVQLLSLVAAHADAEACVCDLTDPVKLSQPTVSHHLKVLVEAGILAREQRGKWAYYRVVDGTLQRAADALRPAATRTTPERG